MYSLDVSPIEQLLAKLKHMLCTAAVRSVEALVKRIAALLDCFSPEECANYVRSSGIWQYDRITLWPNHRLWRPAVSDNGGAAAHEREVPAQCDACGYIDHW